MGKKLGQLEKFKQDCIEMGNENFETEFKLGNAERKLHLQTENLKTIQQDLKFA